LFENGLYVYNGFHRLLLLVYFADIIHYMMRNGKSLTIDS